MKRMLLALLLTGCSVSVKPDESTQKNFQQLASVINAMANYIEALQQEGTLPKPEELVKRMKLKEGVKALGKMSEAKGSGKP